LEQVGLMRRNTQLTLIRLHSDAGERCIALESLDFRCRQRLSPLVCAGCFGTTAVTATSYG